MGNLTNNNKNKDFVLKLLFSLCIFLRYKSTQLTDFIVQRQGQFRLRYAKSNLDIGFSNTRTKKGSYTFQQKIVPWNWELGYK